ncbi:MAG: DNRLRE domain-containing protein [Deltaproteobacteria bacterium]
MIDEKRIMEQIEIEMGSLSIPGMKLLFILDKLEILGGLETYLINLCQELNSRGHKIMIDCSTINPRLGELFTFAEIWAGKTIEEIQELISTEEVDLIHCQSDLAAKRGLLLHQLTRIPFVITWHGAYSSDEFPVIAEEAERIVCVSEEIYNMFLIQYPAAESKMLVIQNGVSITDFRPGMAEKSSGEVTFIGRIGEDRVVGLKCLIEGFMQSSLGRLNIIGLESLPGIEENPRLNFVGEITNVYDYIAKSDIVVATGRGAREAMACGKPCIVMSNWGYDGIVIPSQLKKMEYANFSGRGIGRPLSSGAILHDLDMLSSAELRSKLGIYGRYLAEAFYDNVKTTDSVVKIYIQAIKENKLHGKYSIISNEILDKSLMSIPVTADCTVNSECSINLDFDPIFLGKYKSSVYRYYAKTDLIGLSNDIRIVKALFQFFCLKNDNIYGADIGVYQVLEFWDETEIDWLNHPAISDMQAAKAQANDAYSWITFDITDLVRQWVDNTVPNYGICLKSEEEAEGQIIVGFNRHCANLAARPRLIVEYTDVKIADSTSIPKPATRT